MVNVRIYIVIIDVDHKVYHYPKGVFVIRFSANNILFRQAYFIETCYMM